MRILILTPQLPFPPDNGAKIREFYLLKHLSDKYNITLFSFIKSSKEINFVQKLEKYCNRVETVVIKRHSKLYHLPGIFWYLIRFEPPENKFFFSKEMQRKIMRIIKKEHFDIVQIEHSIMAPYVKIFDGLNHLKMILTLHNVESARFYTLFKAEKDKTKKIQFLLNWIFMKKWEAIFAEKFNRCIVTSENESKRLYRLNPRLNISIIPNGIEVDEIKFTPANTNKNSILFIGTMNYEPNVDAVLYFYKKIFPFIKREIQDVKFFIVGKDPPSKIEKLGEKDGVIVTGYVNDIQSYYEQCDVSVVPLRSGGGTRLKILESMAFGRPVISTSFGCEGLDVKSGVNIIIANKTEEFIVNIIRLLKNKKLRNTLALNARKLVEEKYNYRNIAGTLGRVYQELTDKGCD
ncbi:MAG: glycosyltransferase family 4 protein [Candidatus Helarchaeota archaeon]